MPLSAGSLFSGIGGFDKGLEDAGFEIAWQIENDPFCNKVLAKHWPGVNRYGDIREAKGEELKPVDLVAGGPPCQPASVAGKRKGTQDNRWLWPETLRIVREIHPSWCLFENPTGILSLQGGLPFEHVLLALEDEGYEVSTFIIPACAIGAPHRRDRVWIFAHAINSRMRGRNNGSAQRMQSPLQTQGSGSLFAPNPAINGNGRYPRESKERQIQQSGNGVEPGIIAHSKKQLSGSGLRENRQEQDGNEPSDSNRVNPNSNRLNGNDGRYGSSKIPQFQEAEVSRCDFSNSDQQRLQIREMFRRNISEELQTTIRNPWKEHWYEALSRIYGIHARIPRGLDRHRTKRLKSLGNAVVPGLVEIFGRMIIEVESIS